MSNSMNPKKNRLSLMALEHRWVFDGAAPVDALHKLGSDSPLHLFDLAEAMGTSPLLAQAQKDAQNTIAQWMSQPDAAHKLASIYAGGQPSEAWLQKAQGVVDAFGRGELTVRVELRSSKELNGAWGAFAGQAGGEQVIYLNADWVCTSGNTSLAVGRVLAEEWGHFLDVQLNGAVDATGDEGEAFSDAVYQINVSAQELERIATENDHLNLTIDGRVVQVEMASLLFGGQSYFAGVAPANADSTGPAGQTAQLESNTLYIGNALPGTRTLFVSDPPSAASYSGNNVRGTLYSIDASNNITASYYGEISRLIKIGSAPVSAQMYVYPDGNPTNTGGLGTTIIIDFYATAPNFSRGTIAKTSSDPVAAALNSLLPVNQAPTANPDTGYAQEAGGLNNSTAGSNATGNVISGSDTDPNSTYVLDLVNMKLVTQQDSLTVTKVSNASAATSATAVTTTGTTTVNGVATATTTTTIAPINGLYGTLTMAADGTYSYVVNNSLAAVQALRGTSNTLSDVYTYTVSDGKGGFSTTTLTITVRGANDNPLAKDDYNFAKESIESTVANQYGATDAFGQKATGNVLPNDTDVDGYSETKRVAGVTASATVSTVSTTLTLNFNSVPSNVSVGRYVWLDSNNTLDNVTGTLLKDASGNPITVTAVTSTTATLSGVPVNAQGVPIDLTPNMILGFSNNTAGASYSEAQIKDAGIAPSNTLRVNALGTGQVAVGMTVSGDGVPSGTTITGITYNADGTINRITISSSIAVSSATLNFSAATFPMTLTGQYGTLVLQENGDYVYTPFANNPALNSGDMKVDAFRYNMWDAAGAVSTATLYINVMGSGPSDPDANADTVTAVEAGGTANGTAGNNPTGNLLSNDALGNVPSGATLSVVNVKATETAPANAAALTNSIDFEGVTYAAKVTGQYGDLYVKADGTYRYVVNNDNPTVQALRLSTDKLTDTFQYKITNGSGFNWSSLTVTINGANDAPLANNDSITAIVGEYVPVGNVLANDTDVDAGDTKTVTKIALGSTLPGSNNVTSSTTYNSGYTEIQGTYGTLRIGADGSFTYLVDANNATIKALGTGQLLASPDVFTYEMRDAAGLLSTATMTMNVEGRNDAPVNTLPATFTAQEGSSYAFTGAGNTLSASDIDNNLASTTVSVLNGTLAVSTAGSTAVMEGGVQVGVQLAGGAVLYFDRAATAGGDLTLTGNGTSNFTLYGTQAQINAALASLVYTPNVGYVGSDTLKIESIDAEGLKDVDTVSVTVAAPTLTVTGTTVNEASPYTLFSVSGKEGQSLKLSLESTGTGAGYATLGTDTGLTLQYFNGNEWLTYNPALNGGYVVMPSDGDATSGENATLLVRVANVQDTTNEGAETLKLVATNAAGTAANGTSTIKDDGTGSYFAADNNTATSNVPAGVTLDDDRPLTVNSITVNEGSPYAVFTVSGAAGQLASLNLAGQNSDGSNLSGLQYWDGDSWETYTSGTVALDSNGQLLVRVALSPEQETALDGPETFNLVATNTGGTSGTGQATIKDDGTGALYTAANPTVVSGVLTPVTDTSTPLDDDRALNVNSFEINEGSPYAVFTVTGASNQLTTLTLTNGTTTGMTGLEVYTGGAWVTYTGGTVALDSTGKLLVRTSMTPEQETGVDNGETFTLTATNTGGTGTPGTATVKDDGTGTKWSFSNVTTDPGTSTTGPGAGFDDDRVVTVSSPLVNEASPYAVFTVDGAQGQLVSLSLGTGTATSGTDYTASMEISTDGGLTWSAYSNGLTSLDGTGGTLLVRVPVKQDTTDEPGETFTLTATKTNAVATTGTATIVDDGNGDIFNADGSLNTTTVKDDDRPVTVTSVAVNEASPYAVLTVDGELNQLVSLSLVAGATNPATAAADYQSKIEYSTDNGGTWTVYTGGNVALAGTNGTMLVRVPVVNDATQEVDETFRLVATNTGGTSSLTSEGVVTIQDDGNGTIFNANGTENTSAIKDDDRPLMVSNETVNEAAGPAVFTVTGVAGQLVKLELQSTGSGSGDALISGAGVDIGSTLRYSLDGGSTWLTYNPATNGGFVAMTGTTMKVEVVVNRDALVESSETYQLAATNTGGSTALGTGTITDYAPPVTAVTSTAGEAGGTNNTTAGTPVASGDLATGVDLYSLKFGTAAAVTSPASGTTYVDGAFGRLTFAKDGTWSYAATEGDPDVQALRLTSNTLNETFTYTVVDAYGAKSSNTLTITIQGANDAPVANPDYNTAKESLAGTTVNNNEFLNITAYSTVAGATYDRLGYKAIGDVLPNDTDVDAGDTKTVSLLTANGAATGTTSGGSSSVTTLSFTTLPSNVKVGYFVFYANQTSGVDNLDSGSALLKTSSNANVTVTAIDTVNKTFTLSGAVSNYSLTGTPILGFANSTAGASYKEVAISGASTVNTSTVNISGFTGQIAAGMTVSGGGLTGASVTEVNYDANGKPVSIVISTSASFTGQALTFSGSIASGQTLTGSHGSLVLNNDGSYTYGHAGLQGQHRYRHPDRRASRSPARCTQVQQHFGQPDGQPEGVVNDTLNEGTETLRLIARNDAGGASATTGANLTDGIARIRDDGQGNYFPAANTDTTSAALPAGTFLNDDRPLTVSSVTVNEASPYATFTVTGANGQKVLLDLANASGTSGNANLLGDYDNNPATANTLPPLQYFEGGIWKTYDASNPPAITSGTTLLVRVGITAESDSPLDGPETFNLVATNTGGTSGTGEASIVDDGTGSYFAYDPSGTVSTPLTAPAPSALDDDRPITVTGGTYNEGSPRAVFTVDANPDQWLTFDVKDVAGNGHPTSGLDNVAIYYSVDGGAHWLAYTSGSSIQAGAVDVLVAVDITPESESPAVYEGNEQLQLLVNTGLSTAKSAYASIVDDGTGVVTAPITASTTNVTGADVGGVKDDDRLLTVSNVTVNEGSPYAVFTVTGPAAGQPEQKALLSLANASGNGSPDAAGGAAALGTNPALQYFEGGVWKTYNASNPPVIAGGASLLVRVAINAEQEMALDGSETFKLVATNTGGTTNDITTDPTKQGIATIKDDGTGSYWIGDATAAATADQLAAAKIFLDDDRITPVTISSPKVNEGSPFAVFTVSGALNQLVSLNLAPGTAGANVDFVSKLEYSPDGTTWLPYTGGNVALTGTGGTLLVRVPIINDDTLEPDETFTLTATNTGGTPSIGTATITDDGNGAYWFGDSPTPATAQQLTDAGKVLDDDRPLTIAPVTVNEASPFAVFTVTGSAGANPADQAGQLVKLNLNNVTTSGLSGLQWYDPTLLDGQPKGWTIYTPNSYVPLDSAGKLLVRVAISPEQEALQDGPETFNLVAANTGGTSTTGLGTIRDDGQGLLFSATNIDGAPENPGAAPGLPARLDDDRPLTVGNITVNEGSPVAVFTVTGAPGQVALLSLGNAAAANPAGDAIGGTAALGTTLPTLQYYNPAGSGSWVNYDANNPPALTAAGNLLVRVSISPESDGVFDGPETFQLRATNTGNSTGVGTATILDDGTGSYWIGDATVPATPAQLEAATIRLDDDRPITVKGGTYNEGSPRAVFTVTANAGQLLTLGVEDVQTTGLASAPLSYSVDGGATWLPYTGTFVAGPVPVLVAVNITSERDEVYEVSEEFKLVVNPGLPTRAAASGFIVDDGTGAMYDAGGAAMPESAVRDDDRPRLQVTGPASPVSEGSPAVFTVTLSKTLLSSTPIDLALNPGTASAGDFAMGEVFYLDSNGNEVPLGPVGGPYAIPAGVSTFYVRALTTQDSNYEGLESLRLVATLPANVGGDSQGADAGIIDDGSGVVYTGRVDPLAGLLVDAAAIPDDDRPVAAMVDPAPAPAPAVVPPALPPSAPSLHVQFAVADARAATSGAASVASGGVMPVSPAAAGLVMQALDAQFEKFERPTDPNLFVLPAVNAARGQASEAQVPSVMQQSGLLWNERLSDGIGVGLVLVSQGIEALTLADAELARLMDEPAQQAALEVNADDAAQESERQKAHLRAARLALAQSQQDADEPVRGHTAFSRQLQQAGKRPVWMARSSRA